MSGKISRVHVLKYTPSGVAILEFTLAVPQQFFDKASVGNFEMLMWGAMAEEHRSKLRIGNRCGIEGILWVRSFRNRQGKILTETKVLVHRIEGESQ